VSDTRLRELERAAKAGDLDAHGAYLQERVRQGSLEEVQVELLAYLLWPPAWRALGWQRHGHSGAPAEEFRSMLFLRPGQEQLYEIFVRFPRWAHGLKRWGEEASLRVGVAAARHRMITWRRQYLALHGAGWDMPCPLERIDTLLHMLDLRAKSPRIVNPPVRQASDYKPSYTSAAKVNLAVEGAIFIDSRSPPRSPVAGGFGMLAEEDQRIAPLFAGHLARFAGRGNHEHLANALQDCVDSRLMETGESWGHYVQTREQAVFQAIRNELVPFVLGDRDAVAQRLAHYGIDAAGRKLQEER
jgi:hypothetical protein